MKNLRLSALFIWPGEYKTQCTLRHYEQFAFCLLFVVALALVACSGQSTNNDNYPTHTVGFWIRRQDNRWVAFEADN